MSRLPRPVRTRHVPAAMPAPTVQPSVFDTPAPRLPAVPAGQTPAPPAVRPVVTIPPTPVPFSLGQDLVPRDAADPFGLNRMPAEASQIAMLFALLQAQPRGIKVAISAMLIDDLGVTAQPTNIVINGNVGGENGVVNFCQMAAPAPDADAAGTAVAALPLDISVVGVDIGGTVVMLHLIANTESALEVRCDHAMQTTLHLPNRKPTRYTRHTKGHTDTFHTSNLLSPASDIMLFIRLSCLRHDPCHTHDPTNECQQVSRVSSPFHSIF